VPYDLNSVELNILRVLRIKVDMANNLKYLYNKNLKNFSTVSCDGKQMILENDQLSFVSDQKKQSMVIFRLLDEQEESCSRLIINDSIYFYLRNLVYNVFNRIITIKDNTYIFEERSFDTTQLDKLENPTKNTKYKFYNLCNIVTATSFSKNLISFSIDLTNSPKDAKVDFKFPLYDALSTIKKNNIFGIHLEDCEIKLFKQIYENYIIDTIDNLFKDAIEIPENSSSYPQLYVLLRIKLMLEETFWTKYNIKFIPDIEKQLLQFDEMLSDLNKLTNQISLDTEHQQKLDRQSYRNELDTRKKSEPNWLLLKDSTMQENLDNKQTEVITDTKKDIAIESFEKHLEENRIKYINKINSILFDKSIMNFEQNYQIMKNNQEWSEIFLWQKLVLDILNASDGNLWFDIRIDKYCFRSKIGSKIVYKDEDQIGELLTRALADKITNFLNGNNNGFFSSYAIEIVFVSKLKGINKQRLNVNERSSNVIKILLFKNEITTIDDDKFDIFYPNKFIKFSNELLYTRNRFIPTKYLMKRFNNLSGSDSINYANFFTINETSYLYEKNENNLLQSIECAQLSFIEQFIFYLVDEDCHIFHYVMNWLAVFFNSLQKSGTALVLLGDQEVTQDILWNKIIKEIFGSQYCITLNDEECSTASSFAIAKDKLFFHIGDILNPATQFDDTTLYKLVKDFLIKPSVAKLNEKNEQEENTIHGQMIITAKNPFPYIKRAMSKCTIIKVNDMDTIIEKLGIPDQVMLEDKIQKDLDNFTDILRSFQRDNSLSEHAMDTKDRETIKNNKSPNVDKEYIDNKIDAFIQAIKDKNIGYFEKVKDIEDGIIYEHLKNAFDKDEGYFIGQDLLDYYNSIHEQKYDKNKQLMDKLKEKDDMFNQEVKTLKILDKDKNEQVLFQSYKTSKETKNKELYKIEGYKMAKDIIIPDGATIISSQENFKKYTHENSSDIDNCIKRTEEYRAEKAREKEQK